MRRVPEVQSQWADFARLPPSSSLSRRLEIAIDLYPCDLLFIHRDAESLSPDRRREEISRSLPQSLGGSRTRHVPVVPVRMTEAWLLTHEDAIRAAAGNPRGTQPLSLPALREIERLPDPKQILLGALTAASGLNARRRSRFDAHQRIQFVPLYMDDYSRLRSLTAFQQLQDDIDSALGLRAN
jgi:hypothetical protein